MARRLPGKRVDKWDATVQGVRYRFEVRLLNDGKFLVSSLEDFKLRREGATLADVKKQIKQALEERTSIKWDEWFRLSVRMPELNAQKAPENKHDWDTYGVDLGLTIEVDRFLFGITPDGRKVHKSKTSHDFREGWPIDKETRHFYDRYIYLQATKKNDELLREVAMRLHKLGALLGTCLSQKNIEKALSDAADELLSQQLKAEALRGRKKKAKKR